MAAAPHSVLRGKRVLVTGAGRGIGRAVALICAEEGAQVAVLSRTASELSEVAQVAQETHGAVLVQLLADVRDEGSVRAAVAEAVVQMGGVDVLVNNAGGGGAKLAAEEQPLEDFRKLLDLNVVAVLNVCQQVLSQAMLPAKGGSIINISSRAGKIGIPKVLPYCASKWALEGLTATLAEELRPQGIAVNSISPGMVDTKSFPKPPGKPGVRPAEGVRDALLAVLGSEATGTYLHVDELDTAVAAGLGPECALKQIAEPAFTPSTSTS